MAGLAMDVEQYTPSRNVGTVDLLVPTSPADTSRHEEPAVPSTSFNISLDAATMPIVLPLPSESERSATASLRANVNDLELHDPTSSRGSPANGHLANLAGRNGVETSGRPPDPRPLASSPDEDAERDVDDDAEDVPRLTASEKGKGKASSSSQPHPFTGLNPLEEPTGRGRRVKKRRRLSDTYEVDKVSPQKLERSGSQARPDANGYEDDLPSRSTAHPASNANPRRSKSINDSPPPIDISSSRKAKDDTYFARLEVNARKPPLSDMKGPCPVWSATRKALSAATEYLRDLTPCEGGSVCVAEGGVARGLILEGNVLGEKPFWGEGEDAGSIAASL
jgi:hypothetical protein